MRFTTAAFLVFFLTLYIIYWMLRGRPRLVVLLVASLAFYAFWSIPFLVHFAALVLLNYAFVRRLRRQRSRGILALILSIDVANLFFFKYFYFFLRILFDTTGLSAFQPQAFNALLGRWIGADSILLPLGISFYTFQIIAYVVDVYRGNVKEEHSLFEYAVFTMLFLQLTAGPILRHSHFFGQSAAIQLDARRPDANQMLRGIVLLQLGLAKKILIADNIARLVQPVFQHPELYDGLSCGMASVGYAVQVFADFSGYTDLARGLALLLGLEYPENFAGPYLSRTVSEFWRRWHITLSSWLRDYIYIPLGGSRATAARTSLNLIITFTIGGIWHGANYTYFVWGFTAGVFLALERILSTLTPLPRLLESLRQTPALRTITNVLGVFYAFSVFLFGALFFNAPDVGHALTMLQRLLTLAGGQRPDFLPHVAMLAAVMGLNWIQYRGFAPTLAPAKAWAGLALGGFVLMLLLGQFAPGGQNFIYYQF